MRKVEVKEQLLSDGDVFTFTEDDRVVGVTIKNQGTSTALTAFGQSQPFNQILPLSSESYGGIAGYLLIGQLSIDFESGGDDSVVLKIFTDKGEYCE